MKMTSEEEIVWEEPPPPPPGRWERFVETLKEKPGEWAVARAHGTHGGSFGATQKRLKALGAEAKQVKVSDDEWRLYARWPKGKR